MCPTLQADFQSLLEEAEPASPSGGAARRVVGGHNTCKLLFVAPQTGNGKRGTVRERTRSLHLCIFAAVELAPPDSSHARALLMSQDAVKGFRPKLDRSGGDTIDRFHRFSTAGAVGTVGSKPVSRYPAP